MLLKLKLGIQRFRPIPSNKFLVYLSSHIFELYTKIFTDL
jgi:hypothetical protein